MGGREFVERRVLVTGAGAGIGRAITSAFVNEGAWVAAVDMVEERVADVAASLSGGPGRVLGVVGDIRTSSAVERIVSEAADALGRIDVLVNNAAMYPNCPVVEMDEEQWDAVIDTNLKGTFLMSRAVARRMLTQRITGHIISIASGAYQSARLGASHYCASKAGVVMFSKVLAQELAAYRIHVNVVSPGLIDAGPRSGNPVYRETLVKSIPWGRPGQPSEIADAVLFLASRRAEYITGTVLDVNGGSGAGRFFLPYSRA